MGTSHWEVNENSIKTDFVKIAYILHIEALGAYIFGRQNFQSTFFAPFFNKKCEGGKNYRFEEKPYAINHLTSKIYKFSRHFDSINHLVLMQK